MNRLLDCTVNYFGLDDHGGPSAGRYFSYHVLAGPGPTEGAGVATITTLAVSPETELCRTCRNWHPVETGGPEAAVRAALHYLDVFHAQDHVRRAQSEIRGLEAMR